MKVNVILLGAKRGPARGLLNRNGAKYALFHPAIVGNFQRSGCRGDGPQQGEYFYRHGVFLVPRRYLSNAERAGGAG